MQWDWATFGIGIATGVVGGFALAFGGLLLFAMGMRDE
jgi:hypothetical protein